MRIERSKCRFLQIVVNRFYRMGLDEIESNFLLIDIFAKMIITDGTILATRKSADGIIV
jgi:hypothetical protein